MPTDPQHAGMTIGDPAATTQQAVADLQRRSASLERQATVQVGSGIPVKQVRDGTLYVDGTGLRLYVRVGGAWKSTALS